MLSNPPPPPPQAISQAARRRQQHHRRQNSTPAVPFDGIKTQPVPAARSRVAHRRGYSLDTRPRQMPSPTTAAPAAAAAAHDFVHTVSTPVTNTGLATNQQHHVLREAQQQRIQARPGLASQESHGLPDFGNLAENENYLVSPHETPLMQDLDSMYFPNANMAMNGLGLPLNAMMQKSQLAGMAVGLGPGHVGKDFELFGAVSPQQFVGLQASPTAAQGWVSDGDANGHTRQHFRRVSNGIMDRVNKFESFSRVEVGGQTPTTPTNENGNWPPAAYLPPTPLDTPATQHVAEQAQMPARPNRFTDGYDESMEETIKPNRGHASKGSVNVFDEMRRQSERMAGMPPAPSHPVSHLQQYNPMGLNATEFIDMNSVDRDFIHIHTNSYAPIAPNNGLHINTDMAAYPSAFDKRHDFEPQVSSSPSRNPDGSSRRTSPHRRTESLASLASAASIASINIEETKTETGVTMDDIASYIDGPDPVDNKWLCTFGKCGKKFGRKENIKSHVQTHLNDRQYQCPSCHKCFVRQHDLKRHAKIHTGIKPYPCECGNSFARHDALTRHRQRGMCVGAFDGIVRKVVKRGRPRKHRPDTEERVDKATRTRQKNQSISSISSFSTCSDSSIACSPRNDDFDILTSHGYDFINVAGPNSSFDQLPPLPSHPISDMEVNLHEYANSPEMSHSYVSPEAIMEPDHPLSPTRSVGSHYNTLPDLSRSASPPGGRLFDAEHPTSCVSEPGLTALAVSMGGDTNTTLAGAFDSVIATGDDELMLKSFHNTDGIGALEHDGSLFSMSKFDEEMGNVSMLTNESDMFLTEA